MASFHDDRSSSAAMFDHKMMGQLCTKTYRTQMPIYGLLQGIVRFSPVVW